MPHEDLTLSLVHEALRELDDPAVRLTAVMRKAIRAARLRNDWDALYWLQIEMVPYRDRESRKRIIGEIAPHYSRETFKSLHDRSIEQSIALRTIARFDLDWSINTDGVTGLSVPEIEEQVAANARSVPDPLPTNMHPVDLYHFVEERQRNKTRLDMLDSELRKVLSRIGQRVHDYLSTVERQLVFGQLQSDIFEENRRYVDDRLTAVAPEVREQLQAAYRRTLEGTSEGRSHALTSCRRVLKSLADRLYPARKEAVRGNDGKERLLNDAMFVARLWQFIAEAAPGAVSTKMLIADVEQLGKRIDRLNELSSKGVHADVGEFEVNMCVLNTYSVVGALLRLHDGQSAVTIDPSQLEPSTQPHS